MKNVLFSTEQGKISKTPFLVTLFSVLFLFLSALTHAQSDSVAFSLQNTFRQVSSEIRPVVVQVDTVNVVKQRTVNPFEFFFRFPRSPRESRPFEDREFERKGIGSGVLVERRGRTVYVLTNNHVIEGADEIKIHMQDGRIFNGTIVGGDSLRDLALVEFKTNEDVPIATLGDSDSVQVGDWALAVGSPLGLESTVTAGIISAKSRQASGAGYTDYLQTDASINQGNSGGALVNLNGEVIGINTFIASNSGGSIGLGFAIPINNAKRAINDFITKGSVEYAWLGVNMGDLTEQLTKSLKLNGKSGAFIHNVYNDSPALKGDIRPGDLITSLSGKTIESSYDLSNTVASLSPKQRVPVTLVRDGKTIRLNVTLDVRSLEQDGLNVNIWPGFSVVPVTSDIREQMKLPRNAGNILIGGVVDESAASVLGLRNGDVIKSINRKNVRNMSHFFELVNSSRRLELKLVRQGQEVEFILNK